MGYNLSAEEPRKYVLATDNSAASQAAFALLIRKMLRKKDTLNVIMVSRIVSLSNRLDKYQEQMELNGVEGKVEYVTQHGNSVGDAISEYVRQQQADFLVMGISGYDQAKIGSVSLDCCYKSRSHVILIKDPREVEENAKKNQGKETQKSVM